MKRLVYRVRWDRKTGGGMWALARPDLPPSLWSRKADAVELGRELARARWECALEPSQLVVHNRDGRIAFEHTYGRDPERRRG